MTQKFTKNILYVIHPFSCRIIYRHVQTIAIAINTHTTQLITLKGNNFMWGRSPRFGFSRFFLKNLKTQKFGLLRFLFFFVKKLVKNLRFYNPFQQPWVGGHNCPCYRVWASPTDFYSRNLTLKSVHFGRL